MMSVLYKVLNSIKKLWIRNSGLVLCASIVLNTSIVSRPSNVGYTNISSNGTESV